MKPLFFSLKVEKRDRILEACFDEFSAQDYEHASLDRIVDRAGISKGGLYEYIDSKEDLYLHVIELVYSRMYGQLALVDLPPDILARFRAVSAAAIDFYLDHPRCIAVLVRSGRIADSRLTQKILAIFEAHFGRIFDTVDAAGLAFPRGRLIDLMKWLLAKTRTDFLTGLATGADRATLRSAYLDEWEFLLAVLKDGIYVKI